MNIQASERLKNLPTYAFKQINDKKAALKEAAKNGEAKKPIDFGVGDPSEPTPSFVIENMTKIAQKHAKTGYPSYTGSADLREAAAKYMQKNFGVTLDPQTEICSNIGSKEAIFNFPEAFINPGDVVICPSPGYPAFKTGTMFAEGKPYYTPLLEKNGWLIDFESIPEEIVKKAKIMWLNYPNSPTGAIATREYYEKLSAWAKANDIILAADEGCYIDIYFEEKPMSLLEVTKEGVVAFYSLSKRNNMTGYRAGFVCGDPKIIEIYKQLKTNIDSGTPNIVQEAAILALNDDDHAQSMRDLYKEKRDILLSALEDMGLETKASAATFYVWQRVPEGLSDTEFASKLLDNENAIIVTPGSLISDQCDDINPGSGYVRFALMPTMEEMHEAADRLRNMKF